MPIDKPGATRRRIDAALLEASLALDALRTDENALGSLEAASELMIDAFSRGGRVYACGNGGSMSDAMHFAEELTGRFGPHRVGGEVDAVRPLQQRHLVEGSVVVGIDQLDSTKAKRCVFTRSANLRDSGADHRVPA